MYFDKRNVEISYCPLRGQQTAKSAHGSAGTLLARTDVTPAFLLVEMMAFLIGQRIVRPGYTTQQDLITNALSAERDRLEKLVEIDLTDTTRKALQQLLERDDALSELAALKQDAKSFRYRQMGMACQKRLTLAPLYAIAKTPLPTLDISQLNIAYYASLANFYTIYDLRRFKPSQTNLYLLCYAWQRYRQLTDNIVEAFGYHTRCLLPVDTGDVIAGRPCAVLNRGLSGEILFFGADTEVNAGDIHGDWPR